MSSDVELSASALEASRLRLREINAICTFVADTTPANIVVFTDNTNIQLYAETNVQPTPAPDTGCNFPTLDSNAAPALVGFCVLTGVSSASGTASKFLEAVVPLAGIVSATMTAGVCTQADKWGVANTGVTASGNLAFTMSLTGLDGDAAIATHVFPVIIRYLCVGASS